MSDEEKWFYCGHCGTEAHGDECDDWHYVCRYANGEAYRCPHCQEESVQ